MWDIYSDKVQFLFWNQTLSMYLGGTYLGSILGILFFVP